MATSDPARPADLVDGRVLRSERSRAAIVAALLELVGEGVLQPTAEQIARRARVGLRSVFRHFQDMESIFRAMDATMEARVARELGPPRAEGDLAHRIDGLVARRARLFERIAPYKRAESLRRWQSPFLQHRHGAFVRLLRSEMSRWLPELEDAPPELAQALELLLSFEAWDRLRREQRLGVPRATATTERAAKTLLGVRVAR